MLGRSGVIFGFCLLCLSFSGCANENVEFIEVEKPAQTQTIFDISNGTVLPYNPDTGIVETFSNSHVQVFALGHDVAVNDEAMAMPASNEAGMVAFGGDENVLVQYFVVPKISAVSMRPQQQGSAPAMPAHPPETYDKTPLDTQ